MWDWKTISPFFWTSQSYKEAYGSDYASFTLFDGTHLLWLGIAVVVCVAGILLYRRLTLLGRRRMLVVLTVLMLLDELLKYVLTGLTGQFEVQFLPFHLCSVNLFVCLWHTIRPGKVSANILYCLCLPGAIIALLMPTWTRLPMNNLMAIHSESIHMLLVLYPLLLFVDGFRPEVRSLRGVVLFLLGACVPAVLFNELADTNFMFLNGASGNPLLKVFMKFLGDPGYILGVVALLAVVWALMYLPWILRDRCRRHQ